MRRSSSKAGMRLGELAVRVGATLTGDPQVLITGGAPIEKAGQGEISFVAHKAYQRHIPTTKASALVLDFATECDCVPVLRHENPYLAFARIIGLLYPETRRIEPGIDPAAVVHPDSRIDPTAGVGPLCQVQKGAIIGRGCQLVSSVFVGEDVTIGENCLIHPGVRILDSVRIGNDVVIHPGVVIGSDGFGFARTDSGLEKFPQVGWVEIEDEVEIGANTTIDRGALGATRIGRGTKIDNLVQIAHNVEIGRNCIIVSQVGISGSTKVGDGVILAGQVGLVGHIEIGDQVTIGAQSGVSHSVPPGQTMLGSPARDAMESKRIEAALRRLPELLKRVKKLEGGRPE